MNVDREKLTASSYNRLRSAGPFASLREQVRPRLRKFQIGPAFVQYNPADFDRKLDPGEVLSGGAFNLEEKRAVYLLDIDAAVLNDFDTLCDLD